MATLADDRDVSLWFRTEFGRRRRLGALCNTQNSMALLKQTSLDYDQRQRYQIDGYLSATQHFVDN